VPHRSCASGRRNDAGRNYAESPLIDGDVLVSTPGGETATLVALNKQTGAVLRKAPVTGRKSGGKRSYATAAYSSVIAAHVAGTRQYIQFLSGGVVGIEAATGKLLWHYDHPANKTANCSTPICKDDCVFAASAYGTGGGPTLRSSVPHRPTHRTEYVKVRTGQSLARTSGKGGGGSKQGAPKPRWRDHVVGSFVVFLPSPAVFLAEGLYCQ
jgi:outer membrane protein assembly factor BamB